MTERSGSTVTAVLAVGLLGTVQVVADEAPNHTLRPTSRALLARLALAEGQVVSLGQLVDDLWGDDLPSNPAGALRVVVTRSRAGVGRAAELAWEQGGYVLRGDVEVDATIFTRLVDAAHDLPAGRRCGDAREALSLWRGDALADVRFAPFARTPDGAPAWRTAIGPRCTRIHRRSRLRTSRRAARRARRAHPRPPDAGTAVGPLDGRPVPVRPPGQGSTRLRHA